MKDTIVSKVVDLNNLPPLAEKQKARHDRCIHTFLATIHIAYAVIFYLN